MVSESFIKGMLKQAAATYKSCSWYEFGKKNRLCGWINACKTILKEGKHV